MLAEEIAFLPLRPSPAVLLCRFHRNALSTVHPVLSTAVHRTSRRLSGLSACCRSLASPRDVLPRRQQHSGFPALHRPSLPLWRGQQRGRRSAGDSEILRCICQCRGSVLPDARRHPRRRLPQICGTVKPYQLDARQPSDTPYCHRNSPGHVHSTAKPSPLLHAIQFSL